LAFDPSAGDWQQVCRLGCFRPHVVEMDSQFVMWLNIYHQAGGKVPSYRVLTASSPAGPFTYRPGHGRTAVEHGGDHNVFVDTDGAGYLVATDITGRKATASDHEIVVQALSANGLDAVGTPLRLPGARQVEAPTMWRHRDRYYLAISDPMCGYCPGTGLTVFESTDPLREWGSGYRISQDSCGGQLTHVSVLPVGGVEHTVVQIDRWVQLPGDTLTDNQALASQAWVPLSYTSSGAVRWVDCADTLTATSGATPAPAIGTGGGTDPSTVLGPNGSVHATTTLEERTDTITVWLSRQRRGTGTIRVRILSAGGAVIGERRTRVEDLPWSLQPFPVTIPRSEESMVTVKISRGGGTGLAIVGAADDVEDPVFIQASRSTRRRHSR